MGSFRECIIWAYCWTHSKGRCKDASCACTFKKCENFVDFLWKIHRYRHYHKMKANFPTTLVEFRKRVSPLFRKKY